MSKNERDKDENTKVEERLWELVTSKIVIWLGFFLAFTSLRFLLLWGTMPTFKPADNPAAFTADKFSRISTKMYYWFVHYWLLFCPRCLCYDWAFGSIRVIKSLTDVRLLNILFLYIFIALIGFYSLFGLFPSTFRQNYRIIKLFNKTNYSGMGYSHN